MHCQAWYLRRLLSLFNDIVRRPHLPREIAIKRVMSQTGVDLALYGPDQEEPAAEDADAEEGECVEEDMEEEVLEEDPCF